MSREVRQRRLMGDGVELAVFERGPADAPTLVMVHGFPDDHTVWDGVAEVLAERYHVVTYDVRGTGASMAPRGREGYRLEHLANDLFTVIAATRGKGQVHVVGHDWGSIQSWEAVADARAEGRIASFTSISGPCLDHMAHWTRAGVARGEVGRVMRQALHSWYIYLFQVPVLPELFWRTRGAKAWPRVLQRSEGITAAPPASFADDAARGVSLYRANMPERLSAPRSRRVTVPVQIIAPVGDRYVTPATARAAEPWVERLFVREVQGGHWIIRTKPARVAAWITELVEHVEGAPLSTGLHRAGPRSRPQERRLVVITGAGSGIGRATAIAFAEAGAELVLADIDREGVAQTAEACAALGARVDVQQVDVADREAMEHFAAWVERERGAPDVVVNNAGIGVAGPFLATSASTWERLLGVNLWGVLHGCRLFGAQMVARGEGGHIVNVASAAAFAPSVVLPAYATSKAAVKMLSECLRAELSSEGIGVSAICPGIIDTAIAGKTTFEGVDAAEQARRQRASAAFYKRRAYGPERVAQAILRAVEHNAGVVPVSPEAHALALLGRLAPPLANALARVDISPR